VHIYGSSRIGIEQRNITYSTSPFAWLESEQHRDAGTKRYELTDHLGNVRVTISDLLVPRPASSFGYATQDAEVIDRRDYYPFGMEMPGRRWRAATEAAGRFGYNAQERDDEVAGEGNHYTAMFWEYDSRVARRWNLDPKQVVGLSQYSVFELNPITNVDVHGDSIDLGNLYDRNKDGSLRYRAQVHAFELFASSDIGRKYLLEHAQKGFTLRGEIVKDLSLTATREGAKSKAGVDAAFMIDDLDDHASKDHNYAYMPGNAHTDEFFRPDGRLQFHFLLDKHVPISSKLDRGQASAYEPLSALDSWLHEIFFHGEQQERSFLSGRGLLADTPHRNYYTVTTTYRSSASRVLLNSAITLGLKLTKQEIFDFIQKDGFSLR
jgi:hypothetical protein